MNLDPAIVTIASAATTTIFLGSAAMKFWEPMEFRAALENYRLVPDATTVALAWFVPALELAGAVGLMVAATRAAAAMLLLCLLAAFTGAIAFNLARGRRELDCGCFGPLLRQSLSGWLVARNGVLALLAVVSLARMDPRQLAPLDYATIGFASAGLVILYAAANYLLATARVSAALRTRDA